MVRPFVWISMSAALFIILLAGCSQSAPAPTATPAPTAAPSPTPLPVALSLDDYLRQLDCASSEDAEEPETYGDFSALLEEILDRMSPLVPPAEVAAWHQALLGGFEAVKALLAELPQDEEIGFAFLTVAETLEEYNLKEAEAVRQMSDSTRQAMIDAGCTDDPQGATAEVTQDDHADDFEGATGIAVGETIEGSLDGGNDKDVFLFRAEAGQTYAARLPYFFALSFGAKTGPLIAIYDSAAQEVARLEEDTGTKEVLWQAEEAGNYYVVLGDGSSSGDYALTIDLQGVPPTTVGPEVVPVATVGPEVVPPATVGPEVVPPATVGPEVVPVATAGAAGDSDDDHANNIGDATAIAVGEAVAGTVGSVNDVDHFRFTAQEGKRYQIDVGMGTLPDSWVYLVDSEDRELAFNDDFEDSLASRIIWAAPASGDYFLVVGGFGVGTYTLAVAHSDIVDDHGDALDAATSIAVGEAVAGAVDFDDDVDYFGFTAQEGQLYQIDVALGTLPDSWVRLLDSEGRELAYNDDFGDSWASRILWVSPASGDYYLAVGDYEGDLGTYTLTVAHSDIVDDHGDAPDAATSIRVGEAVTGAVDFGEDVDVFRFTAQEGKRYQIDVGLGTLPDSWVALEDSEDRRLDYNDDFGVTFASRIVWTAPASGDYILVVGGHVGDLGTYTLTVAAIE